MHTQLCNGLNPATGSYFLPKVTVKLFGEDHEGALVLGSYLREAYVEAEEFSQLLAQRVKGAGFFKTLLLRRLGSSMEAGRRTVAKLLGEEPDAPDDEDDDDADDEAPVQVGRPPQGASDFKNFTDKEIDSLRRCLNLLKQGGNNDPKLEALIGYLLGTQAGVSESWLERGCTPKCAPYQNRNPLKTELDATRGASRADQRLALSRYRACSV